MNNRSTYLFIESDNTQSPFYNIHHIYPVGLIIVTLFGLSNKSKKSELSQIDRKTWMYM